MFRVSSLQDGLSGSSTTSPHAKRRRLQSPSGDNTWTVSPEINDVPGASRIAECAATNFQEQPGTPPGLVSAGPANLCFEFENESPFWLPSADTEDLNFLHRREKRESARINRGTFETYRPLYASRLNPDGLPKKPCRYHPCSYLERLSPFLQNAIDVQTQSRFTWNEQTFRIAIQNDRNATGQFNIFATILENQPQVIPGKENHEIGLKTFRDHCIMVESGPDRVFENSYLDVLTQYRDLRKNNIPVAKIYNTFEAENGCGFFLVEIVPTPFHADWHKGAPLESLSDQQLDFLVQLKYIFKKSYNAGIIPDLKPDNLRVKKNGELTITDLRERKISNKYLESDFEKMLRSFKCEEGDEIYNFLNPIPQFSQEAVNEFRV